MTVHVRVSAASILNMLLLYFTAIIAETKVANKRTSEINYRDNMISYDCLKDSIIIILMDTFIKQLQYSFEKISIDQNRN